MVPFACKAGYGFFLILIEHDVNYFINRPPGISRRNLIVKHQVFYLAFPAFEDEINCTLSMSEGDRCVFDVLQVKTGI